MKTKTFIGRRFMILFYLCSIVCYSSYTQTIIAGGTVSGIWDLSGSPYHIQAAIMITDGTTLTIDPGVKVEFQDCNKFLVLGQILAIGTAFDSITFTCSDTSIGWLGIRFNNTPSSNDTSKFSYCKFQHGKANGTSSIISGGALYLDNFSKVIVSNSLISGCSAESSGGGIYCTGSSPIITNNTISNNISISGSGGGICCSYSDPVISNNIISNNHALQSVGTGGGICIYKCSISTIINNNTISNNSAYRGSAIFCTEGSCSIISNLIEGNIGNFGSGVYCEFSSPNISYNTFSNNIGKVISCEGQSAYISYNNIVNNDGTGIVCSSGSSPEVFKNSIVGNNGNGIKCYNSTANISYNFITNNISSDGAGIYCSGSGAPNIHNNLLANNSATSYGGGIYCIDNSPAITNNTISNNSAIIGGALYCTSSSSPTIHNTIIWGNSAQTGAQVYLDDEASDPGIYYCDVQGGSAVFGLNSNVFYLGNYYDNIDTDPLFVNPSDGSGTMFNGSNANWSLQPGSPCINEGDPTGSYSGLDIAGNPRVLNGRIDIGAFESLISDIQENIHDTYLSIYPNPTTGKITCDVAGIRNVEIIDIQRRGIFIVDPSNIDISNEPNGIYILRITTDSEVCVEKVIKY